MLSNRVLLRDALGILVFRLPTRAVAEHQARFLAFGLFVTWLAGIGRYWDNPRAEWWQVLGLGSVLYVFLLAITLWAVIGPLRPARWSYRSVLLFVSLTSPPALLYAIPVERFLSMDNAMSANAWFLAVVAIWRVALLVWYLKRVCGLSSDVVALATLFPVVLIIFALSWFNLEHVVFRFMAGFRSDSSTASSADLAYQLVIQLTLLSTLLAPILAVGWAVEVVRAARRARASRRD